MPVPKATNSPDLNRGETRVKATVEREAAQLDFRDFVASADLDRDDVLAVQGHCVRRPRGPCQERLSRDFWGDGIAVGDAPINEWIDDVIDRVVIVQDGELFDAIGNIGKGNRRIFKAELTAPFERFGLPGLQLQASLTFLKSRVPIRSPVREGSSPRISRSRATCD